MLFWRTKNDSKTRLCGFHFQLHIDPKWEKIRKHQLELSNEFDGPLRDGFFVHDVDKMWLGGSYDYSLSSGALSFSITSKYFGEDKLTTTPFVFDFDYACKFGLKEIVRDQNGDVKSYRDYDEDEGSTFSLEFDWGGLRIGEKNESENGSLLQLERIKWLEIFDSIVRSISNEGPTLKLGDYHKGLEGFQAIELSNLGNNKHKVFTNYPMRGFKNPIFLQCESEYSYFKASVMPKITAPGFLKCN